MAAVLLFAGGHGALGLTSASSMKWGAGNFLVRTRQQFLDQGFMVAVVDAPSDERGGMNAIFRMGGAHAGDIAAIVQHLRKIADVPVWMVGTSMGTFSAARGAMNAKGVDGLVLSSTISRSKPDWKIRASHPNGVGSMALAEVHVPTLILSHRNDRCDITPASDGDKLKARLTGAPKVEVRQLQGGLPPKSDPCEAYSQHGFYGIEGEAVGAISTFIKASVK
jgi:pimeloyl-ACP methyl ester carboxylesterase